MINIKQPIDTMSSSDGVFSEAHLLSTFLDSNPTELLHMPPGSHLFDDLWVFCSQNDESSQDTFPSDDPMYLMIHRKIRHVLSNQCAVFGLIQFWKPTEIDGRPVLINLDQPFAMDDMGKNAEAHRLHCLQYMYDLDLNDHLECQHNPNQNIIHGAPLGAFHNWVPDVTVRPGSPLSLVSILKRCLPSASCTPLGGELRVTDVNGSKGIENGCSTIIKGIGSSSGHNSKGNGRVKKEITIEMLEQQFRKSMKVAAEGLEVCVKTLRCRWKRHTAEEKAKDPGFNCSWPGPHSKNRKVEDPENNQKDEGGIITIKAEYGGDVIRLDVLISSATFGGVEKRIGEELRLKSGTYKLKYRDAEGEWFLMICDRHMKHRINGSGSKRILVSDIPPRLFLSSIIIQQQIHFVAYN